MKTGIYEHVSGGMFVHVVGVACDLDSGTGKSVVVFEMENGALMTDSVERFDRNYTIVRVVVDHRMSVQQLLEAKG